MENGGSDKKFVKSVLKALSVIELLDEHGELGVTEIGKELGLDKSTTFRLLTTLKEKNYLTANPRTQKYSNSGKFFVLGQSVLRRRNFNPLLMLELKKLSESTREAVNFAVPDGTEVVYLASYETEAFMKLGARIGQRRPMYCTSIGKAFLAHFKPEYARALCEQFEYEQFTPNTLTTPEALLKDLEVIRRRGYSIDNEEHYQGLYCVGVPLLDKRGEPLAAVSISVPVYRRVQDPGMHERCVQTLLEAAPALRAALLA
ncbi:MAG: IclR family transcriptional regulator [Deltaproteobacteria bacterium]|jgi:DNA-binding IclR family transcriptional regulator|nr:IclR family transcriptional regulator [Deltaproteobacteria bacterium]